MDKFGPFKNKRFETDIRLRWFVIIIWVLMFIGTFIFVGIGVHNYPFKHTYVENPGNPGVLVSDRYTFSWVLVVLMVVAHILGFFCVSCIVIFRENYGLSVIWGTIYFFTSLLLIVSIALMGVQYGDCNSPNSKDNMCNDLQWCCVYGNIPENMCPISTPCVGVSEATLAPKESFLWIFWTSVALAFLHLVFILGILSYMSPTPKDKKRKEETLAPIETRPMFGERRRSPKYL